MTKITAAIAILFSLVFSNMVQAQALVDRPPQYVNLAFDGSQTNKMWKRTKDFARSMNGSVKFTYFVSGVYFLTEEQRYDYDGPKHRAGASAIGFGGTTEDLATRMDHMTEAMEEGHEIASHANGHFDGAGWSMAEWVDELQQFTSIFLQVWQKNGWEALRPDYWSNYFQNRMHGFRAPLLAHSKDTFRALHSLGYKYDTSKILEMGYWPRKIENVWQFPLAGLRLANSGKRTASMDYNLYVSQSGAKRAPNEKLQELEDEAVQTYMNYFNHNYYGNRAPVDIGHHFSLWNGGIYWRVMQRFAKAVCNKPEVICGTYKDLVSFLETQGTEKISAYRKGNFPKYVESAFGAASLEYPIQRTTELSPDELSELQACTAEAHVEVEE